MARGRRFAPSSAKEGIWFRHRSADHFQGVANREGTSTGQMLSEPFTSAGQTRPLPPPAPFRSKTAGNYKSSNPFSDHDNRNAFQDHGVYFGNGKTDRSLGRKIKLPEVRLHYTDNHFLKHFGRNPVDRELHTTYGSSYQGEPTEKPPTYRRFPKSYGQPSTGNIPLQTTTSNWFTHPDVPYRTPTHVLAVSQEPFLRHNAWKYSNHSMRKIYPPYDRKNEPLVNNEFNKYGAAFAVGSD